MKQRLAIILSLGFVACAVAALLILPGGNRERESVGAPATDAHSSSAPDPTETSSPIRTVQPPAATESPPPEMPTEVETRRSIPSTAEANPTDSWHTRIAGRVITEDGRPVADATVILSSRQIGAQEGLATTTTDFDGGFAFHDPHSLVPPSDRIDLSLVAHATGYAPEAEGITLSDDEREVEVTLTVEGGFPFAGEVVWSDDGEPVADAEVLFLNGAVVGAAETDRRGRFRAENLPEGYVYVAVAPPGRPHQFGGRGRSVPDESARIELVRPDGTVRGQVKWMASGNPEPLLDVLMGDWIVGYDHWRTGADAQGRFEFTEVPREGWTVQLADNPDVRAFASLTSNSLAEVDLLLPEPLQVAGVVVQGQEETPVAGLALEIEIGDDLLLGVTDERGRFELGEVTLDVPDDLDRSGNVEMRVNSRTPPWHVPRAPEVEPQGLSDLTVRVDDGLPLIIRVIDAEGQPVEGARVALEVVRPDRRGGGDHRDAPPTDADGYTFTVRPSETASHRVVGIHPLHPLIFSDAVSPEVAEVTATAVPSRPLDVRVLVDGVLNEEARAQVRYQAHWWNRLWMALRREHLENSYRIGVVSGENPAHWDELPAVETGLLGHVQLDPDGDGDESFYSTQITVDLASEDVSDEVVINIDTTETETVTGRVIDLHGMPVSGVTVYPSAIAWENLSLHPHTQTDSEGRYRLEASKVLFPRGVVASAEGYLPTYSSRNRREVSEDGAIPMRDIELAPLVRLRGVLVDATGAAVPATRLIPWRPAPSGSNWEPVPYGSRSPLHPPTRADSIYGQTGLDGRFSLVLWDIREYQVPECHMFLTAVRGSREVALVDFEIEEGVHERDLGRIVLGPGESLEGRALRPDGEPLYPGHVQWEGAGGRTRMGIERWWSNTDEDGHFLIPGVPTGEWRLFVRGDGWNQPFSVGAPSDGPLELVLDPQERNR